jgi:hypothetical protein
MGQGELEGMPESHGQLWTDAGASRRRNRASGPTVVVSVAVRRLRSSGGLGGINKCSRTSRMVVSKHRKSGVPTERQDHERN